MGYVLMLNRNVVCHVRKSTATAIGNMMILTFFHVLSGLAELASTCPDIVSRLEWGAKSPKSMAQITESVSVTILVYTVVYHHHNYNF